MTEKEHRDLRTYCAFLLKEYGFHFSPDDPVIPALYIIHKEMQLNNLNNQALASQVKEAAAKLKPKQFHFHYPGEAWKFQVGLAVRWIFVSLMIFLLTWFCLWYGSALQDESQARTILETSGRMSELLKAVQKEQSGYYFIDFTAPKGDSLSNFKEFRKLNATTVRIYLGKAN